MRRRSLALALAPALALVAAGCAVPSPLGSHAGAADGAAPEPYYKQVMGTVQPDLDKTFELPVRERAALVNVTLALATRSGGLAGAAPTPAQLDVAILAPDGSVLKRATVTGQQPGAILLLDAPAPGAYKVHLAGRGISSEIQGTDYGATYVLVLQAEYS